MEFMLLVAGAVALVLLWKRVDRLEEELRDLRSAGVSPRAPVTAPEPQPAPAPRPAASLVPKFARSTQPPRETVLEPTLSPLAETAPPVAPPIAPPISPARSRFAFDFEELFGRQLPIWAGGITLAVAGFFLVRYAIDVGLLSPAVRVAMGLVFGLGLIAGAEVAHRFKDRVADPRVPQALSGAGLAVLYATVFLAGTFYGLIGTGTAFVGLALVTAAAIGLSFRFGLPSAVLGLVGGFAAPALVGAEESNLPLLAFYLALVAGGLGHAGRKQGAFSEGGGWAHGGWLGLAGIVGGLGWGLVMLIAQPSAPGDVVATGFFLVVLGALLPALALPDLRESRWLRLAAGGFASLQMAALLESSGYEPLSWGLYLLLGAAFAGLSWRTPALRDASAVAGGVGAWMLGFWYDPDPALFAAVAAGLALVFAGVPLVQVWLGRARGADVAALAVIPLAIMLAALWHFDTLEGSQAWLLGLAGIVLAVLPAMGAWKTGAHARWRSAVLEASAVWTAYAAITRFLPWEPLAWTAALAAVALAFGLPDRRWAARAALAVVLVWALWPLGWWLGAALESLSGSPLLVGELPTATDAALQLVPGALAALVLAFREVGRRALAARVLAALPAIAAAHVLFKQAFAIRDLTEFAALGLAERSAWEALLLLAAFAASGMPARWSPGPVATAVAAALAGAALAHFAFYTGLLHNPLWSEQAVGPTPVANLLIIAYAIAAAAVLLLRQTLPLPPAMQRPFRVGSDAVLMLIISLFALSELRQAFAGTILLDPPVGQTEDLLRSLLGIVLAGGFLLWGAQSGTRSWRIGSLVLMLVAVCKVFIYDTAGLEGLARIASFLALGFSLIAIGWFYSRLLRVPADAGRGEGAMPVSPPDPAAVPPGSTAAS